MNEVKPTLTAQDWQSSVCYGCGPENPHSLKANFLFDEKTGEVRFKHKLQGFEYGAPGYVHGGVLAAILDEGQGALCHHIGHTIMTDKLTIKYHKAVPMDNDFYVRCWLTAVRRRRVYTRATIYNDEDELLVSSSSSWYLLPERVIKRLFPGEMSEDRAQLLKKQIEANRKRAKEIRRRLRKKG